ncbi:class I SAM-dependent methyltransferase [Jiella marina]|uniref:class I SAM-dependent methyltransferase n=1 Tax=Jiella sp. LLJ827 TaxID=2917712 RepID=UPI002101731C|nr:methyltransferase domain-containing protein [Jiella sp. LLJ827]MCQ0989360.1 methyltransferase domain-containing protein [Jiella sp. LLJ827]
MSFKEDGVVRHYASVDLLPRILAGIEQAGIDPESLTSDQLKAVDEFHIGGAEATAHLLDKLTIDQRTRVLDIGSGIGGPARTIASRYRCEVTGIDLTPAYVDTATELTRRCGLSDKVRFDVASATALPFASACFDLATMFHVGMNIPDKTTLFAETRRVLSPKGMFAVYDVMHVGQGDPAYPLPWSETPEFSALATPETYRSAASSAGFELLGETDRRGVALAFFERVQAQASANGPAPLGLHLLMGPTVGEKVKNMVSAIKAGMIAPVQMIFKAPAS